MILEKKEFLSLANLPARLTIKEAAWLLGFNENDIPILVAAKLLRPLGHPASSGSKYFSTAELLRLREDVSWLSRASDAIVGHWKKRNAGRAVGSAVAA
jgi:hypothetical protein